MKNKFNCILLIDDELSTNYIHKRIISKLDLCLEIIIKTNAQDALNYLLEEENNIPDLIFLDINMPGMDGWEFLEEYKLLAAEKRATQTLLMLSTSINPDDRERAMRNDNVKDFMNKPLTEESLLFIAETYLK
ncbi:response regulator [Putridiphycobacter roseus]|uniref:Response regulator n=1 Tax=Putridiphycobacter roseus TaxID=2219161 RepID=A0A2W1N576_9FLAO|nr:response regulator [Putridiphycobacter roseus]PZE18271.1 response regulator [Putridiphycobacter roseus]